MITRLRLTSRLRLTLREIKIEVGKYDNLPSSIRKFDICYVMR